MAAITCLACGATNSADAAYCKVCARRLDQSTADRVSQTRAAAVANQSTRLRTTAILIVSIVAAILVIVVVLLAVHVL
jgi:uncharacterized membrane protein YvbJ